MKWPTVPVGEIAQQVRGVSYDKSQVSNSAAPGLRPVLRAGNIQEGSLLLDKDLVYVPDSCIAHQQLLRPGDIVIAASSGSIDVVGKAAQLSEPWEGSFGAFCKVVRPSSERVNPRYLHHFFQSTGYRRKVSSLAAGANINNLKNEHIDDLLLPLPPLEEQRRIAAILDKVSSLRKLGQSNKQSLEALERKIFLDLFGDPVSNDKGWPKGCVGDLVSRFETGKSLGSGEGDISETLRIIRVSAVSSGRFKPEESKPAPRDYSPPARHFVNQGDLLFCRANTDALIGTVAYVEHSPFDLLLSDKVWRFCRSISASYFPLYIKQLFSHPSVRQEIRRRATGTSGSMLNISQSSVLEIPISLPPVDIQKRFHAIAHACLNVYSRNEKQNERLAALASSLGQSFLGR
jgi:type I restriction enzyme S subunit